MKYLVEQVEKKKNEQIIYTVRLEIDYELLTLYDALEEKDKLQIKETKKKLEKLVKKLRILERNSVGQ